MTAAGSDITAAIPRALLRYVERALGPDGVAEVVRAAGLHLTDGRLGTDQRWFSDAELAALADAAIAATGDPEIGRRLGEEVFRRDDGLGNVDFLRSEGDPAEAIRAATAHTGRMVTVRRYDVVESGDTHIVVDSVPVAEGARHRVHCQMLAGYWTLVPGLFGAVGTVTEPMCAGRGDDRCRLVVRWDRPVRASDDQRRRSRRRSDELVGRFEAMQAMAAELAAIGDLRQALDRIIDRAGSAMLANRFVLTVREHADDPPRVFSAQLPAAEADRVAEALWAGDDPAAALTSVAELGTPVLADVAAGSQHFGYLVAFLPANTPARELDERLLGAYAGHAAATIQRVISAEAAEREHRTAHALLGLSHSLAAAGSIPEITELVADAISEVTGCDVAGVWLLDEDASQYRLQTVRDEAANPGPRILPVDDPEGPRALAADPVPFTLRRGEGSAHVDAVLQGWGVEECYVAPIVHRGELHGLLATATQEPISSTSRDAVLAAVSALAHHAGTAVGNTVLLEQVRHQALHDALTGLPNRPQVEDRARQAMLHADRRGTSVALAFVDLDRFKNVNDTLGHVIGDDLIGRVAERLERHVRPSDVVARLGGDEFLLVLPDLDVPERAEDVVRRVLDALREPFHLGDESLFVSASVGIACYPQHGHDYGVLLARADAAMYEAKAAGRNRFATHQSPTSGRRSLLKLESELHRAVERDELRLRFQPQVDLLTDEIVGAEALVRWAHPTLGLVGPPTFLAIAEESGLVVDVDRWVRRAAFTHAAAWAAQGTPLRIAVNVSRRDLLESGLVSEVAALLEELDLAPSLVELEITDRIVMSDEDLPPSLAELRRLGVRLAVDDFGTGSSVLSRLHHCPVDLLKVDRTFVEPLSRPDPDTRLVDAMISMAHALGMEVVIEGIEDELQARVVRRLGAELAQGYHFHRPMTADELGALLRLGTAVDPLLPQPPVGAPGRGAREVRQ